jgi:hypothetical protein
VRRVTVAVVFLAVVAARPAEGAACPPISYGWPVRPFDRAHPVRGGLNDPRDGAFHFGVDITALDGTPVYAVAPGRARVRGYTVSVDAGCRSFAYWHVVPSVRDGQRVRARQRIGNVQEGFGHVHLGEHDGRAYIDPTRPGRAGLTPYWDRTRPVIERVARTAGGGLIVQAHDVPAIDSPHPWDGFRVTPARIGWQLLDARRGIVRPFRWAYDGRRKLPDALFGAVFAPGTRANHPRRPGVYRFWLTRRLGVAPGRYVVRVRVADAHGNAARGTFAITIRNG